MRSEGGRVRVIGATVLIALAAVAVFGGCRGLLRPEPRELPPAVTGHRLVVRVTPPPGVSLTDVSIQHDNGYRPDLPDSLRRREDRWADESGEIVFEDMVAGPTLLEYDLDPPGPVRSNMMWGEIEIPRDTLRMDLSRPNLTLLGTVRAEGEPLEHEGIRCYIRGRFDEFTQSDWLESEADTMAAHSPAGRKWWECRWGFPERSALHTLRVVGADSLDVPGTHDIAPDFSRAWLELKVGGELLRNVEIQVETQFLSTDLIQEGELSYRQRTWRVDAAPLYFTGNVVRLYLRQASGSVLFPARWNWAEVTSGDTLRVDLGRNRVRLLLRQGGDPVPFLRVRVNPEQANLGSLVPHTDSEGEVRIYLPDGRYEVEPLEPSLQVATGGLFEVSGSGQFVVELEEP